MAQMGQERIDIYEHYTPVPEIKEFIDLWCGLKSIPFDEQNFLDEDFCDRIIDCFIHIHGIGIKIEDCRSRGANY